jgi:hypothetical protein
MEMGALAYAHDGHFFGSSLRRIWLCHPLGACRRVAAWSDWFGCGPSPSFLLDEMLPLFFLQHLVFCHRFTQVARRCDSDAVIEIARLPDSKMKMTWPNYLAGVVAGRTPEFIEMIHVVPSRSSGSTRLGGR